MITISKHVFQLLFTNAYNSNDMDANLDQY